MAQKPQFLGYTALLGDIAPAPSKWERLKQALWETNLNAPVRGAYNLMNTPYDVLMGGPSPEMDQAVGDSFDAASGAMVGSMPMPKPANSLTMGIKAYHGSPHSFDKFSMDKIGTGEGAQAYGHGLYFAENEGVAKGYRDNLTSAMGNTNHPVGTAQRALGANGGDVDAAIASLEANAKAVPARAQEYTDAIAILKSGHDPRKGSMYEVNINADPNTFLDWDKPLSEQPEVQARLATIGEASRSSTTKGIDKYISLENMLGAIDWPDNADAAVRAQYRKGAAARVSEKLKEAGIPGIKYLDAGSRGAGDGTRNYVVFDDKLISIVRKYGIAGASAMLGYNLLESVDKAQATTLKEADLAHQYDNWKKQGGI